MLSWPVPTTISPRASGLSAGFMVKMVVLFVAVGGGTYFFDASGFSWYDVKLAIGDLSRFQAVESSQQAA